MAETLPVQIGWLELQRVAWARIHAESLANGQE